ncbi:MAG: hypothetical protein RML12_11290 [Xanthomonadales bacterium]|nr:hypothetical protein [Xanthomonadales bacterium]
MIVLTLLLPILLVAVLVSSLVARLFDRQVGSVLARLVGEPLHRAWQRYVVFAIYVVGISSGVELDKIEACLPPSVPGGEQAPLTLDWARIALELYRTAIQALQGIAWMLLLVFLVLLIAWAIVRSSELKAGRSLAASREREPAAGEAEPRAERRRGCLSRELRRRSADSIRGRAARCPPRSAARR